MEYKPNIIISAIVLQKRCQSLEPNQVCVFELSVRPSFACAVLNKVATFFLESKSIFTNRPALL
ncbi:hypothetical protein Hanom_Chr05g00435481 [Helianthus anomalus]